LQPASDVPLARRRGVNHIEIRKRWSSARQELERVGLMKLEWVARLRSEIHPDHLEARAMVADGSSASTAEKV